MLYILYYIIYIILDIIDYIYMLHYNIYIYIIIYIGPYGPTWALQALGPMRPLGPRGPWAHGPWTLLRRKAGSTAEWYPLWVVTCWYWIKESAHIYDIIYHIGCKILYIWLVSWFNHIKYDDKYMPELFLTLPEPQTTNFELRHLFLTKNAETTNL